MAATITQILHDDIAFYCSRRLSPAAFSAEARNERILVSRIPGQERPDMVRRCPPAPRHPASFMRSDSSTRVSARDRPEGWRRQMVVSAILRDFKAIGLVERTRSLGRGRAARPSGSPCRRGEAFLVGSIPAHRASPRRREPGRDAGGTTSRPMPALADDLPDAVAQGLGELTGGIGGLVVRMSSQSVYRSPDWSIPTVISPSRRTSAGAMSRCGSSSVAPSANRCTSATTAIGRLLRSRCSVMEE